MKYCPQCGAKIVTELKYCPECGARIEKEALTDQLIDQMTDQTTAQTTDQTTDQTTEQKIDSKFAAFQQEHDMSFSDEPTKSCKRCGTRIPQSATRCHYCGKKQNTSAQVIVTIVLILAALAAITIWLIPKLRTIIDSQPPAVKETTVRETTAIRETAESIIDESFEPLIRETTDRNTSELPTYHVGDSYESDGLRVTYVASGEYTEASEYLQPVADDKLVFFDIAFENVGAKDQYISSLYFECYADSYAAETHYVVESVSSLSLSPGRKGMIKLVYTVPEQTRDIELEYGLTWTGPDKVMFVHDGDRYSNFTLVKDPTPKPDAVKMGETGKSETISVTCLSCEDDSDPYGNVLPQEGNKFITIEVEVENISKGDITLSAYDFDCFADNINCNSAYFGSDFLSATLSSNRKDTGKMTFEVPEHAEVLELEYRGYLLDGDRIVLTLK